MSDREYCLEWHAKAVRGGYFLAARRMLRAAIRFRPHGREASTAFDYYRYRGKLDWFQWGN